jgi:type III pantothenate kinase
MTPDVVVDIGNTRMKWGRDYSTDQLYVINTFRRLKHDDPAEWDAAAAEWGLTPETKWVVSGVNPREQERFVAWCRSRGCEVRTIDRYDQIPIRVEVDEPERVGLDRLFGALAAANYYSGVPCVVLDVGTALTVNFVLPDRRFVGGAILPGPRLMANALHDYTAKLPRVEPPPLELENYCGRTTEDAIAIGINAAITGAARELIERFAADHPGHIQLYWTGGGMRFLSGLRLPGIQHAVMPLESLTLTGIWLAAEGLP